MMSGTIAGYVLDAATGEALSTTQVSLTRAGVMGEALAQLDKLGHFSFGSLSPGAYNLGFNDDRYAPLYRDVILEDGVAIEDLQISLTPAVFIKGQIMDDEGFPPQRCYFTLIKTGNRRGKSGYISNSGDHEVDKEGHFSSPLLHPGRYCLRFAGILQKPSSSSPGTTTPMVQQRVFDFLYPNALDVADADSSNFRLDKA